MMVRTALLGWIGQGPGPARRSGSRVAVGAERGRITLGQQVGPESRPHPACEGHGPWQPRLESGAVRQPVGYVISNRVAVVFAHQHVSVAGETVVRQEVVIDICAH